MLRHQQPYEFERMILRYFQKLISGSLQIGDLFWKEEEISAKIKALDDPKSEIRCKMRDRGETEDSDVEKAKENFLAIVPTRPERLQRLDRLDRLDRLEKLINPKDDDSNDDLNDEKGRVGKIKVLKDEFSKSLSEPLEDHKLGAEGWVVSRLVAHYGLRKLVEIAPVNKLPTPEKKSNKNDRIYLSTGYVFDINDLAAQIRAQNHNGLKKDYDDYDSAEEELKPYTNPLTREEFFWLDKLLIIETCRSKNIALMEREDLVNLFISDSGHTLISKKEYLSNIDKNIDKKATEIKSEIKKLVKEWEKQESGEEFYEDYYKQLKNLTESLHTQEEFYININEVETKDLVKFMMRSEDSSKDSSKDSRQHISKITKEDIIRFLKLRSKENSSDALLEPFIFTHEFFSDELWQVFANNYDNTMHFLEFFENMGSYEERDGKYLAALQQLQSFTPEGLRELLNAFDTLLYLKRWVHIPVLNVMKQTQSMRTKLFNDHKAFNRLVGCGAAKLEELADLDKTDEEALIEFLDNAQAVQKLILDSERAITIKELQKVPKNIRLEIYQENGIGGQDFSPRSLVAWLTKQPGSWVKSRSGPHTTLEEFAKLPKKVRDELYLHADCVFKLLDEGNNFHDLINLSLSNLQTVLKVAEQQFNPSQNPKQVSTGSAQSALFGRTAKAKVGEEQTESVKREEKEKEEKGVKGSEDEGEGEELSVKNTF